MSLIETLTALFLLGATTLLVYTAHARSYQILSEVRDLTTTLLEQNPGDTCIERHTDFEMRLSLCESPFGLRKRRSLTIKGP